MALVANRRSGMTLFSDPHCAQSHRTRIVLAEKDIAVELYQTLSGISEAVKAGRNDYQQLEADAVEYLENKGFKIDYLSVRNAADLGAPAGGELVVLIAAWLGEARLIDNILIKR